MPPPSPSPTQAATNALPDPKRDGGAATPDTAAADASKATPTPRPDDAKQTPPETSSQPPATRARTAPTRDGRSAQPEQPGAQARPAESKAESGGEKSQGEGMKPDAPARKVPISGGVLNGRALSLPRPVYPEQAVRVKAAGLVSVEVTIDESGRVIAARAVSGHALLRDAAVAAARRARFSPTLVSGLAVQVAGVINYNFTI
jgi:protein TonB